MLRLYLKFTSRQVVTRLCTRLMVTEQLSSEESLTKALEAKFPNAANVIVKDISGGCGQMFEVFVVCSSFKAKSYVEQHRMVNDALKEQIKTMHALRIHTALPD